MRDVPVPPRSWLARNRHRLVALSALAMLSGYSALLKAEPAVCQSPDPKDWPPPARPFFMIAVDTSGSMIECTNAAFREPGSFPNNQCQPGAPLNSCGLVPSRINDGKCALERMVKAFSEVDFGLMSFPSNVTCAGAAGTCYSNADGRMNVNGVYPDNFGPGDRCTATAIPGANSSGCLQPQPKGGQVLVGLPVTANQVNEILRYTDNVCETGNPFELLPVGGTPINGILADARLYLQAQAAALTPSCRPVNVILITDGGESCDGSPAENKAAATAAQLFAQGDGSGRPIKVFPIGFGGISAAEKTALDGVAKAGQCEAVNANCKASVTALTANNEQELSIALSKIITSAIQPETCDNVDNNCNGCTDEGFKHYCNRGRVGQGTPVAGQCCSWGNVGTRQSCITEYQKSITPAKPQGDLFNLPCFDPDSTPLTLEQSWLCVDPGEACDDVDNNCDATPDMTAAAYANNQVDEGFIKCGNPLKCPAAQDTCIAGATQGVDDDCDGIVDNAPGSVVPGSACPGCAFPLPEICDGQDQDCDGVPDNGVPDLPCGPVGPSVPANCKGTIKCENGAYDATKCTNSPEAEVCDGLDNDCDGKVDNGAPGTPCDIPGKPGLIYQDDQPKGAKTSQCKRGEKPCNAVGDTCVNYVGPSQEVCDGVDNDCDGKVDEEDPGEPIPGVGAPCGVAKGKCTPGNLACVGGTFVCQGGTQPQAELCNGEDDDCDGVPDTDETQFADAPATPEGGQCWDGLDIGTCSPANVCQFVTASATTTWCKPDGADCSGLGTLQGTCAVGTLSCSGTAKGYVCKGGVLPTPEKCDGLDNDCNGQNDDGLSGAVGSDCNVNPADPNGEWPANSPCKKGKQQCFNGTVSCVDAQGNPTVSPGAEVCDGIDNDCNGSVDDNVPTNGQPCEPAYDKTNFPGMRFFSGACKLGVQKCATDGSGKNVCEGGDGPQAEVCDGIDNDCDGDTDEEGAAPDGLTGTEIPNDKDKRKIGDACGTDQGECTKGKVGCAVGQPVCLGGQGPQPEVCDCLDNDCDGKVDNDPVTSGAGGAGGSTSTPICGLPAPGQSAQVCVGFQNSCQCASECGGGEFKCLSSDYQCESVKQSGGTKEGAYCVISPAILCGDCGAKTVIFKDALGNMVTECSPSALPDGTRVPKCVCKGNECRSPCAGVQCNAPLVCTPFGEKPGTCVENNCFNVPCPGGQTCSDEGKCVENPCAKMPCKADEVCKPSTDLKTRTCVKSCANVTCKAGEVCKEGTCKATTCPEAGCAAGEICGPDLKCVKDPCGGCKAGQSCDVATKKCGAGPCEGVVCPSKQECVDGECVKETVGGMGGGGNPGGMPGMAGGPGTDTMGGSAGTGGSAGKGGAPAGPITQSTDDGTAKTPVGLSTGGGGCSCETTGKGESPATGLLALFLASVPLLRRQRTRKSASVTRNGGDR